MSALLVVIASSAGLVALTLVGPSVLLRLHGAITVGRDQAPGAHGTLDRLVRAAGVHRPRLAVMPSSRPNAFAVGWRSRATVVLTEAVFDVLTDLEIEALLAREIARIRDGQLGLRSFLATVIWLVSFVHPAHLRVFGVRRTPDFGSAKYLQAGILFPIWAPLPLALVLLAFRPQWHLHADARAASLTGSGDPLIEALRKLAVAAVEPLETSAPATASLFAINPIGARRGPIQLFATQPPIKTRLALLTTTSA